MIKFEAGKEVIVALRFDKPREDEGEHGKYYVWGIIVDGENDLMKVYEGLYKKLTGLGLKKGDKVSIKKITYTNSEGKPRAGWEVSKISSSSSGAKSASNASNNGGRYTEEEIYAFNIKDAIANAVQLVSAKIKSGANFTNVQKMITTVDAIAELLYKTHKKLERRLRKAEEPPKQPEPPEEEPEPKDDTGYVDEDVVPF